MLVSDGGGGTSALDVLQAMAGAYRPANGTAKAADNTTAHNLVVIDTAIRILETAGAHNATGTLSLDFGGNAWSVAADGTATSVPVEGRMNGVLGGAKDGSGGMGWADIMLKGSMETWVWEIKAASRQGEAPAQLARYIKYTQGGVAGWGLAVSPFIPDGKGGGLRAWSLTNTPEYDNVGAGIRLYSDAQRQNQGQSQQAQNPCLVSTDGCGSGGAWFPWNEYGNSGTEGERDRHPCQYQSQNPYRFRYEWGSHVAWRVWS